MSRKQVALKDAPLADVFRAHARGNPDAFLIVVKRVLQRLQRDLAAHLVMVNLPVDWVEDIGNETLHRAHLHAQKGRPVAYNWLLKVAKRIAEDDRRKQRITSTSIHLELSVADQQADRYLRHVELRDQGGVLLSKLSNEDRDLLTKHYWGGWTREELAQELGVQLHTIHKRIRRACQELFDLIKTDSGLADRVFGPGELVEMGVI